jgi:hypothetical protein
VLALGLATFLSAARSPAAVNEPDDTESPSANPPRPYLRTFLGELTFLVLQGAWYWGHQKPSDSEISVGSWSTWQTKLTSTQYFTFDQDRFNTNAVGHPVAGLIYYQIARGSGLGAAGSFLTSVIASTAWKYFGESNQKLSINDLVVTPMAGWVLGEATYRLGSFFADGEPSFANCVGALIFSPVATLTEPPVCRSRGHDPPFDRFGFSRRTWHELYAELGAAYAVIDGGDSRGETAFGLGARITAHARYQRPGWDASNAWPGQWSSIAVRWLLDSGSIDGVALHGDSLVIGRYYRRYGDVPGPTGQADGRGLLVGFGSSFDYDGRSLPAVYDRTLAIGIGGPMATLEARRGRFAVRASLALSYGFGQVTSLAWAQAAQQFAGVRVKSPLQTGGYYFGQGLLSFATLEADLGDLRLHFDGRGQNFWSFNSLDDHQSELQNNFSLSDTQIFLTASAALRPFGGPVRLTVEFDDVMRDSHLPGTAVTSTEHRFVGAASLVF